MGVGWEVRGEWGWGDVGEGGLHPSGTSAPAAASRRFHKQ